MLTRGMFDNFHLYIHTFIANEKLTIPLSKTGLETAGNTKN